MPLNSVRRIYYDVKRDYGAAGDGVTDDSSAISAAYTAAAAHTYGADVFYPAGIYLCTTGVTSAGVGVGSIGTGWDQTSFSRGSVIKAGGTYAALLTVSGEGGFVEGLSLQGNGTATAVLAISALNCRASWCAVRRPASNGVGVDVQAGGVSVWLDSLRVNGANQAGSIGIQLNDTDAEVHQCKPVNLKYGIKLLSASGALLRGNHITPGSTIGINHVWLSGASSRVMVDSNRFDNTGGGSAIQLDPSATCRSWQINNNLVYQTAVTDNTFAAFAIDFSSQHIYGGTVNNNVIEGSGSNRWKSMLASAVDAGTASGNPTRMSSDGWIANGNVGYVGTSLLTDSPKRAAGNIQSTDGTTWTNVTDI